MGFKLTGQGWVQVEDPDSEEDPGSKKGKRKAGSSSKRRAPPRKSPRLSRGCSQNVVIKSSESSESPKKTVALLEVEDSLELYESVNETADKEDSIEYSAEILPEYVPPEQVSPVVPDPSFPPIPEEIPPASILPPVVDPTPTTPIVPIAETIPQPASSNTTYC